MDTLGSTRPKKGRKLPAETLCRHATDQYGACVSLEGPRKVGKTTVIQALQGKGYAAIPCPVEDVTDAFQATVFQAFVTNWEEHSQAASGLLIESSPWGYLSKHSAQMDAH